MIDQKVIINTNASLTDLNVVEHESGAQDLLFGPLRIVIGVVLEERLILGRRESIEERIIIMLIINYMKYYMKIISTNR